MIANPQTIYDLIEYDGLEAEFSDWLGKALVLATQHREAEK